MKKMLVSSVAFGVFVLASCANQGKMAASPTPKQEIKMEGYLNLPKSMVGSEEILRKEGYRIKNVSERKFVATKEFEPAVIFLNEDESRMETRKHVLTVFKPEGYEGEGSVKIGEFSR